MLFGESFSLGAGGIFEIGFESLGGSGLKGLLRREQEQPASRS